MAEPSQYEKDTRETLSEFKADVKDDIKTLWKEMRCLREKYVNRPPVWTTILIAILTAIVGWKFQ